MNLAVLIFATFLMFDSGPVTATADVELSGWLSQYARGIMPAVVENRAAWGQLPDDYDQFDVYIAVLDCDLIGTSGTLHYTDLGITERVLVTDCSGHATTSAWFERDQIVGEVDHQTAVRRGFVGQGGVRAVMRLRVAPADRAR